jgi:hypothetical protein
MINLTTAYGGYDGYGAYGGVWDDTQMFIAENVPTWITGVTPIDVPEGDEGVEQLGRILDGLAPDQKVLLSARAQMAMWTMLKRSADSIDRQMVATAEIGGPAGESIRGFLEMQKSEIIAQALELQNLSNAAFEQGVPPAYMAEWFPEESQRTVGAVAAAPAVTPVFWIVLAIAIPAAIIAVAVVAGVIWTKYLDIGQQEHELNLLPDAEAKMAYLSRKFAAEGGDGKSGFPWAWVVGIGAAGVGVILLISWAEGTLGRWVSKLSSPGSSLYSIRT